MAILNRKYGYLFLAEPHTGSRACTRALMQHSGSESLSKYHESHCVPWAITFSVVRHPLDIITTYFHHDKRSFFECVLAHIQRENFFYHVNNVERLLRYENGLSKEVNQFLESIGAPPVDFEIVQPTASKRPWWEYYDDTTIRIVEVLLPEIKKYGYTTELYWENK